MTRQWPFRWLVADDVGLGKTIECGLVLMPLIASGRVRRLLILAPAKLVPQWQSRLKAMFDIRVVRYATETDTSRGDFWATASMVVASLQTLRNDRRGARRRLIDADSWDLVVVDEAHHLNSEERTGTTLAYSLLEQLEERRKLDSLLFFTGTPHRGKDYGFFGLMRLLRPDLFDPERDRRTQLAHLKEAMIRNNKAAITDLQGNRLFTPVTVHNREYSYNAEEADFYRTLSVFILDGRAYAATLDGRAQTARMLVLTNLQKLAASSTAAIRRALTKRRTMLVDALRRSCVATSVDLPNHDDATLDDVAEAEETLPGKAALLLMRDEIERLDELLTLSARVGSETKIERMLSMLDEDLPGEPVLLFTEYKATQALVVNALQRRFGIGTSTFINGDERLDGVEQACGRAGLEMKTPDAWRARHYAVRDRYDALVFDRDAGNERATSRILGVGHVLFDTALDEARRLPVNLAEVETLSAPLLIVSVEDEVTGTGAMVQRMIFGVTERAGTVAILRDWEILDLLNSLSLKNVSSASKGGLDSAGAVAFRLKEVFDMHLSAHAPALVRPVSWPELLLLPTAGP